VVETQASRNNSVDRRGRLARLRREQKEVGAQEGRRPAPDLVGEQEEAGGGSWPLKHVTSAGRAKRGPQRRLRADLTTSDTGRAGTRSGDPGAEEVKGGGGAWDQLELDLGVREQQNAAGQNGCVT
jgi:hypothetical protein